MKEVDDRNEPFVFSHSSVVDIHLSTSFMRTLAHTALPSRIVQSIVVNRCTCGVAPYELWCNRVGKKEKKRKGKVGEM